MFKKQYYIFIFIITFIVSNAYAQPMNSLFYNIKANLSIASNPIFFIQNVSNKMNMSQQNKWILIEVEYKTPSQTQTGNLSNSTNELNRDFTIKFEAVLPGQSNLFYLSTVVNYATISFNKEKKYALALIPPQMISRIIPPSKSLNKAYLKNITIRVTFTLDGKTEAVYYYPQKNMTGQSFNNAINSNNIIKIPGGILNRMQSPWSVINYNRYELIKQ
jgi:tRNA U34 2-thiouridine synthase MnmA/TrmU